MSHDEYEFEERAAILEFDAHLPRDVAENTARAMLGLEEPEIVWNQDDFI